MPDDRSNGDRILNREHTRMPQDHDWESESNPFVAFRRFADEQVSSMIQSITGLPSSVAPPQSDRWSVFANDNGYKDMMYRQEKGSDNATEQNSSTNGGGAGSPPGGRDGADATPDNSLGTWPINFLLFDPYSPLHLEIEAQKQARFGVFPSLMSAFEQGSNRSSSSHGSVEPQWREAFEDLLRLENGKPMLERPALLRRHHVPYIPQLIKNGSLGDRWKIVQKGGFGFPTYFPSNSNSISNALGAGELDGNAGKQQFNTEAEEVQSELDLYDRFLHDINGRAQDDLFQGTESSVLRAIVQDMGRIRGFTDELQRQIDQHHEFNEGLLQSIRARNRGDDDTESWIDLVSGGNRKSVPETPGPELSVENQPAGDKTSTNVVFNRTQTERRTRPDGSIWCKTITTKRFADGREETDESVEVHQPQTENKPPADSNEKPKSGWFWKD